MNNSFKYIIDVLKKIGKKEVISYFLLLIIFYIFSSMQPYFLSKIFENNFINYKYIIYVFLSFISTSILSLPNNWMLQSVRRYSKYVIWENNEKKDYLFFINMGAGEYQSLLSEISYAMRSILYENIQYLLQSLISLIVYTFLLFRFNIIVGIVYLLLYCIYLYVSVIFFKNNETGIQEILKSTSKINSFIIDFFKNIDTIFAESSFSSETSFFNKFLDDERKAYFNLQKKIDFSYFILQLSISIITIAILIMSFIFSSENIIDLSVILILIYSAFNLSGFGKQYLSFLENIDRLKVALGKIGYNKEYNVEKKELKDANSNFIIKINNLSFKYDTDKEILRNINLQINYLDKLLILGKNGSGKSTLAKIIANLLNANSGEIIYNSKYLKNISDIGYYSQNMSLFDRSIFDNIIYPNESFDKTEVKKIVALLKLDSLILNEDDLFNKKPGDFGNKFSGGEKQKIIIARSIINKKPVIIYDEINSALDTESVEIFNKLIESELKDRTIILISHRNEGLSNFNSIFEM